MTPDEIAQVIAPLHAASWKTAYRGIMSDHYLDYIVDGERQAHWRRKVHTIIEEDGEIYLARLMDEPVGFLCMEGNPLAEAKVEGAYVSNLHVMPKTKGQGIGTSLLEHGARWASQRGYKQMYLFVYEDNLAARAFYRSNGWHAVERTMSELPDGALAAELRLVKTI
jgi:ribosomal protein S18 acetylase RimI-like enzyme